MNYKKSKIELTMNLITNLSSHHNSNFYTFCQEIDIVEQRLTQKYCQLFTVLIFSFSSVRCIRWPGFDLITVSCRSVSDFILQGFVCYARLIRTRITVCSARFHLLLPEFVNPSSSTRVRQLELLPQLIHWSLKYQGVKCPKFQCTFPPGPGSNVEWPSYTVLYARTFDVFKGSSQ